MAVPPNADDLRWLVSPEAEQLIAEVADAPGSLVAVAERFQRRFPAEHVRLAIEQVELRRRGRAKFPRADRMFFLPHGLEQATDAAVAACKAARFAEGKPLGDLCCGIGGDLMALALRGPVTAVDQDPSAVLLAEANLHAGLPPAGTPYRTEFLVEQVERVSAERWSAWHLDPDRRAGGRRTTRLATFAPPIATIERLLAECGNASIKLAPATEVPEHWEDSAELEWIGRDRQCRQQVAWFGTLARSPGRRRATVLRGPIEGKVEAASIEGDGQLRAPVGAGLQQFLYEPDPAVLAASLVGELARIHELTAIDPAVPYLTADHRIDHPAMQCFEVTDLLPFDRKRVRMLLRDRGIGRLEIKIRGVGESPEKIRRDLKLRGSGEATLVISRLAGRVAAILARRPG